MKTENILHADLLDILFENRNKNYGAYILRKYYPERIYKALGIIFLLIAVLAVWSLMYKPEIIPKITIYETGPGSFPKPPDQNKEKPVTPKTPKQTPQKPLTSQLFVSRLKIVDSTEIADKLAKNLDSVAIGSATIEGPGNFKQVIRDPVDPGTNTGNSTTVAANTIDKNIPLNYADDPPSFPGGTEALLKYLQRNLQNPRDLEEGENISVKILFVVGYDGNLKGFKTIEDGGAEFNNEVIRVLKKMPAWKPGKTAGQNVSVYYTIPVKFVPQE